MADTLEASISAVTLGSQGGGGACDQLIRSNLGNLGRSADGRSVVYRSLDLEGHSLCDISSLRRYGYLESLNISCNNITDLSVLDHLPFLTELNASQNNVSELLSGRPLPALRVADFSNNQIEEMVDLRGHRSLRDLNLSNNTIQHIRGVAALRLLTSLNLANNQVMRIEHLDHLPLTHLNLSGNMISVIENIDSLKQLQVLDLSNNQIGSLHGLEGHPVLHTLDLHGNQISEPSEVGHLLDLHLLESLDLRQNPVQSKAQYRPFFLYQLPWVVTLDREKVSPQEKVTAKNKFSPSKELVAAQRHMYHITRSLQQPVRLKFSTLTHPSEPYPMLILCGPLGAGKGYMSRRLVEDFPTYFGLGISHTTRPKRDEEQDGREYYFIDVDTFSAAEEAGDFLQSQDRLSNSYGLSAAAVEMVAQHGLACVVHMGIEGTLEMKNTHFEPRYVLTVPVSPKCHLQRLQRRGCFSQEEMANAIREAEVCRTINQEQPGFFDAVVNCDFLDDGYKALRDLVMDYAGITPNSLIQSTDSIAPSAIQHLRTSAMEQHELVGAVRESMQTFSEASTTRSSSSQQHNGETTTVDETTVTATTTADTSAVSSNVQEETARLLSQYREVPHGQVPPPPIRNIQSVARSWSRPSTSMSQHSTNSQGRAVAGSSKNAGHRAQKKAEEAVCRARTIIRSTHSSPPRLKGQSVHTNGSIPTHHPIAKGSVEDFGAEEEEEEEEGSLETDSVGSGTSFSRASTGTGFTPSHTPSPITM